MENGKLHESGSLFQPIDSIRQHDADILIIFLSGNGVLFLESTDDDWYRTAHDPINITMFKGDGKYNVLYYVLEEPASPLACTDTYQFCRTIPEDKRVCGPLASFRDAVGGAASLFNSSYDKAVTHQMDNVTTPLKAQWLYFIAIFGLRRPSLGNAIPNMGATALQSQKMLTNGLQRPLEKDQWQLDVTHWWDIAKAATQAGFINAVHGPTDPNMLIMRDNFTAPVDALCENQVPMEFSSQSLLHGFKIMGQYYEALVKR